MGQIRNKLGHYEADALRELGKQLRRQNMTAENCAKGFRISKIIEIRDTRRKNRRISY